MTTTREHLLAIVEPTIDGDTTLEIARGVVERGGTASVVLMITPRVRRDISAYARGADLGIGDAEQYALDRFTHTCHQLVGDGVTTSVAPTSVRGRALRRYVTPDTTAIAIPAGLAKNWSVRRLTSATGLPVVVTPRRAA